MAAVFRRVPPRRQPRLGRLIFLNVSEMASSHRGAQCKCYRIVSDGGRGRCTRIYTAESGLCSGRWFCLLKRHAMRTANPPGTAASLPVTFSPPLMGRQSCLLRSQQILGCCSDRLAAAAGVFSERDLTRSIAKARALVRQGRLERSQTGSRGGKH